MRSVQEVLLAKAGRRVRAAHRKMYPALPTEDEAPASANGRGRAAQAPPPKVPKDPLDGVKFAHPRGKELAERAGLAFGDFASSAVGATGRTGYTVKDVRAIAAECGHGIPEEV